MQQVNCDSNLTHRLEHDGCDDFDKNGEVPINDLPEPPVLPQVPNEITVSSDVGHDDQVDHDSCDPQGFHMFS